MTQPDTNSGTQKVYVDEQPPIEQYMDHYSVRYYCGNCSKYGYAYFKKGIRKQAVSCSNCKCTVEP